MVQRAVFVGRFCPFHKGHLSIMQQKIDEGKPLLILVRDTHYDIYPPRLRKRMIEATMAKLKVDAKVLIIDDIESINYGRGVGYEVNEIKVPENIQNISATEIRSRIDKGDTSWKEFMAPGADRILEDYLSDKGIVVWFTGLPCSGKTTISNEVGDLLQRAGMRYERLDGDVLRETLTKDLGFSKEDRVENLKRATFLAKMLARNGVVVLASFITPYEENRARIRQELEEGGAHVIEAYVKTSLEECKRRDVKGMYKKAEAGQIKDFTGVDDTFEEPKNPDIILDTEKKSVEECANEILEVLDGSIRK